MGMGASICHCSTKQRVAALVRDSHRLLHIWMRLGLNLAIIATKEAVDILGVQGPVAALQGGHGGCPEVPRAARVAVDARQAVTHPQRRIQCLLQLALHTRKPPSLLRFSANKSHQLNCMIYL